MGHLKICCELTSGDAVYTGAHTRQQTVEGDAENLWYSSTKFVSLDQTTCKNGVKEELWMDKGVQLWKRPTMVSTTNHNQGKFLCFHSTQVLVLPAGVTQTYKPTSCWQYKAPVEFNNAHPWVTLIVIYLVMDWSVPPQIMLEISAPVPPNMATFAGT